MISDEEYLERVVASIQAATTDGAQVNWNEKIGGRQFDVVMRFKLGALTYLVLIEVRDRTRKAEAEHIEAFVTKTRDSRANKAVFVTAAGFQTGAIEVAKRHGVDLFTVTFDDTTATVAQDARFFAVRDGKAVRAAPPRVSLGEPVLAANFAGISLIYKGGHRYDLPAEQSQMNYYARKTRLADGRNLSALVESVEILELRPDETLHKAIDLRPPQRIEPPDNYFFPPGTLRSVDLQIRGVVTRPIIANVMVEPSALVYPVVYTNVITGESLRFDSGVLPLGVKRVEAGKFYCILHPLMYYFCEDISGSTAHYRLVESFQNGELFTCDMKQDIRYSPLYVPVTHKGTLRRLRGRLEHLRQLSQAN